MIAAVRDLKDHLSAYLRRVQAGERIIVTDHDRPVAELVPLSNAKLTPRQRLSQLERDGEVTAPRRGGFVRVKATRTRGRSVSSTLLEDRG